MLRLFEERREPGCAKREEWFSANFHAKTAEDLMRVCPRQQGKRVHAHGGSVIGKWCDIVNRGLIEEDFFFESSGEQWAVWES